jgi:hypothetical protein
MHKRTFSVIINLPPRAFGVLRAADASAVADRA